MKGQMDSIAKPTLNPAYKLRGNVQESVNASKTHHVLRQFPHLYVLQPEADAVLLYKPCSSFGTEMTRSINNCT
jgi:16S rRNA C967 or C1407 C5-methylase (RsmB/RsmF family)